MNTHSGQLGLSLVEVMIAMTLGLIVMVSLSATYVNTVSGFAVQEAVARRQENLRYALAMIVRDLRTAGYRGCMSEGGLFQNTLNSVTSYLYRFNLPIQGFEASLNVWQPSLDVTLLGATPRAGSDILTVRGAMEAGVQTTSALASTTSPISIGINLSFSISSGDLLMISDCTGADVFQAGVVNTATGLINRLTGGLLPGNATQTLSHVYPAGSQLSKVSTISYFVADSPTGPALWRRDGSAAPLQVANGIENLQVQYGEDTDANNAADVMRSANQVSDWSHVVSARVALLGVTESGVRGFSDTRSFDLLGQTVGPFNDKRMRSVVTATVAMRNQLP